MAQKTIIIVSARKITSPQGSIVFDGGATTAGTTRDVTLAFPGDSCLLMAIPPRTGSTSTNDTLFQTASGWKIEVVQEYADINTALSATDSTSS